MKKILFLTDLNNGEDEDLITIKYLKNYYFVDISYIDLDYKELFNYDLIILRNTWPNNESSLKSYNNRKNELLKFLEENNLKIYNELKSDFDRKGKYYLVDLYNKGYNVVPSFLNSELLPNDIDKFILKPLDGLSSYGQKELNRNELLNIDFSKYILQAKLEFEYEVSFYFVNDNFLYSLIFSPSKIPNWPNPIIYKPSVVELSMAKTFVNLNKMKNGVSRIDFLKLNNGELKLLEIEDDSPYFSITEINNELCNLYLKEFKLAIDKFLNLP